MSSWKQGSGERRAIVEPLESRRLFTAYTLEEAPTLGGVYAENNGPFTPIYLTAMNSTGALAGWSKTTGNTAIHAYLFDSTPHDLGTLGGTNSAAVGVSENKRVAGTSYLAGDVDEHAFYYENGAMHDLGTFGGSHSAAVQINAAGQVAGVAATADDAARHLFLYSNGQMSDLGTLGGSRVDEQSIHLNAAGQIAGSSTIAGDTTDHAYFFDGVAMRDLGTLGGTLSHGLGLNDAGQVIGIANLSGDLSQHAFLYSGDVMRDLGTLGGTVSTPSALNAAGQVVGDAYTAGDAAQHAFLYSAGQMHDLGTLGGSYSGGYFINDVGQVAGVSTIAGDGHYHGFFYDGTMHDISLSPDSDMYPSQMNGHGQVVGMADTPTDRFAFLYSDGVTAPLDAFLPQNSGWRLRIAWGINDAGQIYGLGEHNGVVAGFRLTPTAPTVADVTRQAQAIAQAGALPANSLAPLLSTLSAAQASLADGAIQAARGQLGSAENKIDALLHSGRISQDNHDQLVSLVEQVLQTIR